MKLNAIVALLSLVALTATTGHANIKNEQTILGGALIRAGVSGQKPLSDAELTALCEQGVTQAYFLYRGATDKTIACNGGKNRIHYSSHKWTDSTPILEAVNAALTGNGGRVFVHCNNGAHASGYIAAVALRQFCGLSVNQAQDYWRATLGGYPLGGKLEVSLLNRINSFSPLNGLAKSRSCP